MPRFMALFAELLFVSALGTVANASAQGGAERKGQFFRPLSLPAMAASAKVGNAPGVRTQATPVQLNAAELFGLRYLDEIQLTLPTGITHVVVFELARDHGGGVASWVGYIKGLGNQGRVIVTTGPGGSYGVIDTPDGSFRIVPGGAHDWLVDMTQEQLHLPIRSLGGDCAGGVDLAGVQFWISQIATGARTRENVRQAFVGSTEFSARVAAVIAQGCLP